MVQRIASVLTAPLDATDQHPSAWAAILGGAGLGLLWGTAARLWMRLISTTPEFSIAGTAAILSIATLFGAWAGLAFLARRRGWQGWKHYAPRVLMVLFFLPFGIAGGLPLMLTVLVATLGITQCTVVGLWVVTGFVLFVAVATDIVLPTSVIIGAPAVALAFTGWKWFIWRWHRTARLNVSDFWIERSGRLLLLLLAAKGLWVVAAGIVANKPMLLGLVAILLYLLLLYLLFLALRIGLKPKARMVLPEEPNTKAALNSQSAP